MKVRESYLPYIGKKFEVEVRGGDKLVIVIHNDGCRKLYHYYRDQPEQSMSGLAMDEKDARLVAGIIGGMAYSPRESDTVDITLDNLVIEGYKLEEDFSCLGKAIGDMNVRQKTEVSILAVIEKDHRIFLNPLPEYVFSSGSTVIAAGERKNLKAFKELIHSGYLSV